MHLSAHCHCIVWPVVTPHLQHVLLLVASSTREFALMRMQVTLDTICFDGNDESYDALRLVLQS